MNSDIDGGPFFSKDRKWVVYRAYHPKTEQEIAEYNKLLQKNLIRPTTLEIWILQSQGAERMVFAIRLDHADPDRR